MLALPLLAVSLALAPPSPADTITGAGIVRMMHDRYAGRWYTTATFTQRTIRPNAPVETWYEALSLPGGLRIDISPLADRSVLLFRNDSIYQYVGGELKPGRPFVHPLMLLGFDVYALPPERTSAALTALGYDLSKAHAGTWQGRAVWIVGAAAGDSTSNQFWIDQARLVFVRSLGPHPRKPGVQTEVQFNKYVKLGQGWIETEVLQMENGAVMLTEEYHDVRAEPVPALDPAIFVAGPYLQPGWVRE